MNTNLKLDCIGIGLCTIDRLMLLRNYPAIDVKTEALASRLCGGGPIPNALFTLSKLGGKAAFCGKAGDDEDGMLIKRELESAGVDVSSMILSQGERTPNAHIWVDAQTGSRNVVLDKTGIASLSTADLPFEKIKETKYLLFDGRDTEAQLEAASYAKKCGAKVALDLGSPRQNTKRLLENSDILICSEKFARAFTEYSDPKSSAEKFLKLNIETALITLGERGCVWANAEGSGYSQAYKVEVVDTTGAGDVFHGAFMHGLIRGWKLEEIVDFSQAAAAIACTVLGGRGAIESEEQVMEFMRNNKKH